MRNRMYGGVRGRKTKVGEKLLRFPPTRLYIAPPYVKKNKLTRFFQGFFVFLHKKIIRPVWLKLPFQTVSIIQVGKNMSLCKQNPTKPIG